ncbi:excisionase family DNA binding protein [Actimicrobium sp. GrIS 1.19]|uniref:response regulator n=1 Tax=Actimicrobium sp. GrIS 1.19 TaxID=3071708 RepID=UPI002E037C1D|nr:excisionase family DNA binding protein [Actimicrobium sp. GrIS 1.19]
MASSSDICTTQTAATILGISVTSVQQLVKSGVIPAWTTSGGHRRISLADVHDYKAARATASSGASTGAVLDRPCSILLVEDNQMQRTVLGAQIASWNLPIKLRYCENGYQALVEIAHSKPDVLLIDIVMKGIDGFDVIRTILGYPDLADMHIAILSGLAPGDLSQRGGVPAGVVFFSKPVNLDALRGYLLGCGQERLPTAGPR